MNTIDEQKAIEGHKLAEALGLKTVGSNPFHYELGSVLFTSSAIGVYETVISLAKEAKMEVDSIETATGSSRPG